MLMKLSMAGELLVEKRWNSSNWRVGWIRLERGILSVEIKKGKNKVIMW